MCVCFKDTARGYIPDGEELPVENLDGFGKPRGRDDVLHVARVVLDEVT